jgi:carboxylesterase
MAQSGNSADNIIPGANTIDFPASGSRGVLLLHGFGDTPQTFAILANELHAGGFGVRAPLLPGHGRSVEDFVASRRNQWLEFARLELADFKKKYSVVSVVGLSMGAALAALLAAENPDLRALVLIAPYFGMRLDYRAASMSHWIWGPIAGIVKSNSPNSIHDPAERGKNLGYGVYTGRLLYELWRLARRARLALPRICVPTLLIQSREDPRVAPSIAEHAFVSLGATDKKLVWTEGAGHIITVDYGRERVFEAVRSWLSAHM